MPVHLTLHMSGELNRKGVVMTSETFTNLKAENEIIIALYNALDESLFNDELVSLETLDESADFIVIA